jgi:hypothetical protein
MRIDAAEHRDIAEMVSAAIFPVSRAALMQDEHRPRALADDEVALPMASPRLSMVFGRSWINARSLRVSREALARRERRRCVLVKRSRP